MYADGRTKERDEITMMLINIGVVLRLCDVVLMIGKILVFVVLPLLVIWEQAVIQSEEQITRAQSFQTPGLHLKLSKFAHGLPRQAK